MPIRSSIAVRTLGAIEIAAQIPNSHLAYIGGEIPAGIGRHPADDDRPALAVGFRFEGQCTFKYWPYGRLCLLSCRKLSRAALS